MARQEHNTYKIVLIGEHQACKSSFLERLTTGKFTPGMKKTIGVEFARKEMSEHGCNTILQIWDTAGIERYAMIVGAYIRDTNAIILFIDLCAAATESKERFKFLQNQKSQIEYAFEDTDTVCFVVFTKNDLADRDKTQYDRVLLETTTLAAMEAAGVPEGRQDRTHYYVTSALTGENVEATAKQWNREILKTKGLLEEDAIATLTLREPTEQKSGSSFLAGLFASRNSEKPKEKIPTFELPSRYDF